MADDDKTQTYANDSATSGPTRTPLTQPGSRPVRYRLIDKDGNEAGVFENSYVAASWALKHWPDQEQDETRSGNGWDIEVVR